jgi:dihydroflavonol-4-reductase
MQVVTGATGHVGNVLVRELLKKKYKVRAVIEPGKECVNLSRFAIERAYADILDLEGLADAFSGAHTVYHLAAMISILPGQDKVTDRINYEGTKNVIEACRRSGVKRLVYMSSVHALKEPITGIIDEALPFDPLNDRGGYDRSKAKASIEVLRAVDEGLDAVIVCPSGVIGPYDYLVSSMARMITQYSNNRLGFVFEGAYDFVDVRDVARGSILASEKGRSGQVYILSGQRRTIRQIFSSLDEITGPRRPKRRIPMALAIFASFFSTLYCLAAKTTPYFTTYALRTLMRNSYFSHAKATKELGYMPRPVKFSLRDTVSWFKKAQIIRP